MLLKQITLFVTLLATLKASLANSTFLMQCWWSSIWDNQPGMQGGQSMAIPHRTHSSAQRPAGWSAEGEILIEWRGSYLKGQVTTSESTGLSALEVSKQGRDGGETLLCTGRPGRETQKHGSRGLHECVQDTGRKIYDFTNMRVFQNKRR